VDTLTVNGEAVTVTEGVATFTMPASDVTVTATFKEIAPAPATFTVTVNTPVNGTVTADPTTAEEGATVTLTVAADEGYVLDTLLVGETDVTANVVEGVYTFTLTADVTVSATFKAKVVEPVAHTVTVTAGENGTASASKNEAVKDEVITITASPNGTDYVIDTVTVNGVVIEAKADGTYSFVMPDAEANVVVTFKAVSTEGGDDNGDDNT
jgi:hypothetical protein